MKDSRHFPSPGPRSQPFLLSYGFLAAALAALSSPLLPAEESAVKDEAAGPIHAPAPKISEVRQRVERMQDVRLDLSPVLGESGLEERKVKAKEMLAGIINGGDPVLATHAIAFLSYVPDPGLEPALRARLGKTGGNWSEKHLEMGANHYLALLGDKEALDRIVASTESNQITLRARSFRALRDIEPASVEPSTRAAIRGKLESACENEKDPACQAASLSALACWSDEVSARRHFQRLESLASRPEERRGLRAAFETRQIKRWSAPAARKAQPAPQAETGPGEEFLEDLLRQGGHDERMFALEALAQKNSGPVRARMAGLGTAPEWKDRLQGAFYLMLVRDMAEADARLRGERHPFVQLALLCAMGFDTVTPATTTTSPTR